MSIDVQLILADWANSIAGKLYLQGGGWTRIAANRPVSFALAAMIIVPYTETNQKHSVEVSLVTEDGDAYPPDNPATMRVEFEVGRPPGMKAGEEQIVPIASNFMGMVFQPGGYRFEARMSGDEEHVFIPFRALEMTQQ